MSDDIKTDAKDALDHVRTVTNSLITDAQKGGGWVRTHIAWVIGLACLILGFVAGHVLHR